MGDWQGQRNGPDFTVDILKKANKGAISPRETDPVAEARAFLGKGSVMDAPWTAQDESGLTDRLDWNKQNAQMGHDIAQQRKGGFRRATEGMSGAGDVASQASLATTPLALAGLPEVSGGALALAGLLHAPDQLRRAYAPQADETRPGVGEAIGTGLEMLPALGLAGKAGQAAEATGPRPWVNQAKEVPYANRMPSQNPNQVLGVARDIVQETGDPLESVLRGGRKSGTNGASVDALMKLAASGSVEPTARLAREAEQAANLPKQMVRQMNYDSAGGMRTNRYIGGLQKEGPGGLSAVAAGRVDRIPMPKDALQAEADKILARMTGPETDLSGDLSPLDRASRQARAKERFGRSFQDELVGR